MNTILIGPSEAIEIYNGPTFDIRNIAISFKIVGLSPFRRDKDFALTLTFKNSQGITITRPLILKPPDFYAAWRHNNFDEPEDFSYYKVILESNSERELKLQFFFMID